MDIKQVMVLGAIGVSVIGCLTFAGALVMAYRSGDQNSIALLVGAVVALQTSVINYWIGSSAGSQKKDDAAASLAQKKDDAAAQLAMKPNVKE